MCPGKEVLQLDAAAGRRGMNVRSATQKLHIDITTSSLNLISHYSNYLWADLY